MCGGWTQPRSSVSTISNTKPCSSRVALTVVCLGFQCFRGFVTLLRRSYVRRNDTLIFPWSMLFSPFSDCHVLVKRIIHDTVDICSEKDIRKVQRNAEEHSRLADLYHAFHHVHSFTTDPFTDLQPEVLLQVMRDNGVTWHLDDAGLERMVEWRLGIRYFGKRFCFEAVFTDPVFPTLMSSCARNVLALESFTER